MTVESLAVSPESAIALTLWRVGCAHLHGLAVLDIFLADFVRRSDGRGAGSWACDQRVRFCLHWMVSKQSWCVNFTVGIARVRLLDFGVGGAKRAGNTYTYKSAVRWPRG